MHESIEQPSFFISLDLFLCALNFPCIDPSRIVCGILAAFEFVFAPFF